MVTIGILKDSICYSLKDGGFSKVTSNGSYMANEKGHFQSGVALPEWRSRLPLVGQPSQWYFFPCFEGKLFLFHIL